LNDSHPKMTWPNSWIGAVILPQSSSSLHMFPFIFSVQIQIIHCTRLGMYWQPDNSRPLNKGSKMPWRIESRRNQKQNFIDLDETRKFTKSELCRHFGISRPTGDASPYRYTEAGYEAPDGRYRRPRTCPNRTAQEIEYALIEMRNKYLWGARKLLILM
jgi:hypothetical protein